MPFFQDPPRLGNEYDDDTLLRDYLARTLPPAVLAAVEDQYRQLGALSGGHFFALQQADCDNEPVHVPWDPWGNRIDRIDVSPLWREAEILAAERGLVAAAYEGRFGALDRVHQFAMTHIIGPSLDVYTCPLAMTDGAARTLIESGNRTLIDRVLPRLLSRDPRVAWTSGQWMTERTGGSDVGTSEAIAHQGEDGWRLWGSKWFTSATTAQMALTLARPEGNGPGGRGLALFFVELRDAEGRLRGITVNRLKDKLGTRKVPTAELTLEGTPAELVGATSDGVRAITPMLNITRTWNAVQAASGMRRACALARDYAGRREAFGARLIAQPLHADTLAGMEAERAGAFLLAFRAVELLGRKEARDGGGAATDDLLLRTIVPIAKLTTGKQAVAVASEALEAFGGAGYVEDTGLPRLLRDAQVLPIWEGTTNVLSLDTLRALGKDGSFAAIADEVGARIATSHRGLAGCAATARRAIDHAAAWLADASADGARLEAGARRFALTLGRTLELAYLTDHAAWCMDHDRGPRAAAAALRFAASPVDLIADLPADDAAALA